jgi:hypothetical protein
MPMLTIVTHLTLVDTDRLTTKVTIFGEHVIKASETIRLSLSHYVPLTAQLLVAIETCKMFHMPSSSLRFRTFIRKYYLSWGKERNKISVNRWDLNAA